MAELAETTDVAWDLSDLYQSPDDPRIEAALADVDARARQFAARYTDCIDNADLDAATLGAALRGYEAIRQDAAKPGIYARLRFTADTSDPARGAFQQKVQERLTALSLALVFFHLELARCPEEVIAPLLDDPAVVPYRHYVETARKARPHQLPQDQERLLLELSDTGARAFVRLSAQVRAAAVFRPILPDGTMLELNFSRLVALYSSPDRTVRQAAAEAFVAGANANLPTLTFILNTLLQDKAVSDRLRAYAAPEETGFQRDELPRATVELVTDTTAAHYPLAARYYKRKRELLGCDALMDYDLSAPLFQTDETRTFDEARAVVLNAFGSFSPVMQKAAAEFFDGQWIDAAPRAGKQGGAYCSSGTPDTHAYIFLNYMGKPRDVMTLAHELGHGVHASLSREQTYLNLFGTLPMAEVASTFGEMLVFDSLQRGAASRETRLSLYAEKIEGAIGTIMSTTGRYRLEKTIHRQRREGGELTSGQICDHWEAEMNALYGGSVQMTERMRLSWSFIPHFVQSPFYSYPYTFGELFALALYQKSQNEGPAFADVYFDLLRAGGRDTPPALARMVGVDLDDAAFWQGGFRVLERLIGEFEALCAA